jgi:selenoprotein W-related protein
LTQELLSQYTPDIETITLLPSSGGRFEVSVGDEVIYSKKATGRHVQPGEIADLLEKRFGFTVAPVD